MGNPAGHTPDGEQDGEHFRGYAHGPIDDTTVKVDIGVKLAFYKEGIAQGDLFQVLGNVQEWIGHTQFAQDVFGGFAKQFGTGVEILVDPVPKAH